MHSEDLSLPVTSDSFEAVGLTGQHIPRLLYQLPHFYGPPLAIMTLVSSSSPANLFVRDLLCKFNATIKCHKKGIFISQPSDQIPSFLQEIPLLEFHFPLLEIHLDLNSSEEGESLKDVPISL